jgi:two-component system NtrC family sensor kinase
MLGQATTLTAEVAVAGLLVISAALYRAHPQEWLIRWNLAWVAYLLHLVISKVLDRPFEISLLLVVPGVLLLGSQAGITAALGQLAWKPQWERRLLAGAVLLIALYIGLSPWLGPIRPLAVLFGLMGTANVVLAWFYAESRARLGAWLLVAAMLGRMVHLHHLDLRDSSLLDSVDMITALFAVAAGLAVVAEEMHEQMQWRRAGTLVAGGLAPAAPVVTSGVASEIFTQAAGREFQRAIRADYCRLLLESEPEFPRMVTWLSESPGPRSAVLTNATEREQACLLLEAPRLQGLALIPLLGNARILGLLVVGHDRRMLGSPADLQIMDEVGRQAGRALETSRLLETISRAHEEWVNTVNSLADLVLVHDEAGRIERVNHALAARVGWPAEQLVGRTCREVLPGAGVHWQTCPFCESPAAGRRYDSDLRGHFLVSTSPRAAAGGCLHIVRDISDRHLAEERYQNVFENVREGLFISSPEGRLLDCNEALARMLGFTREELLRINIPDIWMHPEDRLRQQQLIDRQDHLEEYEVRLRRKDGAEVVALETSFATRDDRGRVIRYQGFLVDVTERVKAESELLRHNEILTKVHALTERLMHSLDKEQVLRSVVEELRRLFDFDTVAVYLADENTLQASRAAATGYQSSLGQQFALFPVTPENLAAIRQARRPVIDIAELGLLSPEIRAVQMAEGMQSVAVLPLVGPHLLAVIAAANRRPRVLTRGEETLLGNIARQVRDALENAQLYEQARRAYEDLRQAQEKLLQTEKMAALGQLVSGVAHELNNPLAAIIGYAQLLGSHVSGKGADFLAKLLRQTQRTQKIIQDLLSFSRQSKPERHLLDLNHLLEDTLLLRDFDLRSGNVSVVRHYAEGLPQVIGDKHQLEQVILNIVSNALDAMSETQQPAILEVRTYAENRPGGRPAFAGARFLRPSSHSDVVVEFSDSGPGVKEPARIFDPFYTTKKVGQGTGLGLSICYGIVKEHGGEIELVSRESGGATFRVRLPAVEVTAESSRA